MPVEQQPVVLPKNVTQLYITLMPDSIQRLFKLMRLLADSAHTENMLVTDINVVWF